MSLTQTPTLLFLFPIENTPALSVVKRERFRNTEESKTLRDPFPGHTEFLHQYLNLAQRRKITTFSVRQTLIKMQSTAIRQNCHEQ